jgi:hypothetical protein
MGEFNKRRQRVISRMMKTPLFWKFESNCIFQVNDNTHSLFSYIRCVYDVIEFLTNRGESCERDLLNKTPLFMILITLEA